MVSAIPGKATLFQNLIRPKCAVDRQLQPMCVVHHVRFYSTLLGWVFLSALEL